MMPWFTKTAFMNDARNIFEQLRLYARDSQFYCGVKTEVLSSHVCKD